MRLTICIRSPTTPRWGVKAHVAPPLIITHAQIDELIDKARKSLDMTLDTLTRQGTYR